MQIHNKDKKPVLLFDGVCNLCNGWVNFIIDHDPDMRILFAPLQSGVAKELLKRHGRNPDSMSTVVLLDGEDVYERSDAVLRIIRYLKGMVRLLRIGVVIPRSVRDRIYDLIARKRYDWFGRRSECRLPEPGVKNRFLEMNE